METAIDITKAFKRIMLEKDLRQYEVGQRLGIKNRQPFNRLLQKNNELRVTEVTKIADGLDCDVKILFIDRTTGKEWPCDLPESTPKTGKEKLRAAFKAVQAHSVMNGTDSMTMEEINAEIEEARKEKREKI
jgi:transcriptional regulator with XRE-family HTH domain